MPSSAMRVPVATTTSTTTSVKTYVAIAAIGGASFAAAMFMAAGQPAKLAVGLSPEAVDVNIVEGQNDVVTLAFQMAARNNDVTVETLIFDIMAEADGDFATIEGGIDAHDYIENCSLYQDGVMNGSPQPLSLGQMAFRNTGIQLVPGTAETLEVQCNFANQSAAHTAPFAFALKMPNDTFVEAEETNNGNSLLATQILAGGLDAGFNTQPLSQVNMYEHGKISFNIDPATPNADIILPSAVDKAVGIWEMTAMGEDVNLEKITFELASLDSDNNISSVKLIVDNGVTQTEDVVVLAGGLATFRPDILALQDTETTLTLSVSTTASQLSVGGSGTSGERIKFSLNALDTGTFEGIGAMSGHALSDSDLASSVGAETFVYYYTKPTVTLSAVSPSGAGAVGMGEVFRFNIAADAKGDVEVSSLTFKVTSTDNASNNWNDCTTGLNQLAAGDFNLIDLTANPASAIEGGDSDWSLYTLTEELCSATPAALGYVTVNLTTPVIIPAGTTHTFALQMDTTGASAALDDSVRLDIPATEVVAADILMNGIFWDDGSGASISGYLVDNLTVNGSTIVF